MAWRRAVERRQRSPRASWHQQQQPVRTSDRRQAPDRPEAVVLVSRFEDSCNPSRVTTSRGIPPPANPNATTVPRRCAPQTPMSHTGMSTTRPTHVPAANGLYMAGKESHGSRRTKWQPQRGAAARAGNCAHDATAGILWGQRGVGARARCTAASFGPRFFWATALRLPARRCARDVDAGWRQDVAIDPSGPSVDAPLVPADAGGPDRLQLLPAGLSRYCSIQSINT